jgi:tetratricopeptide (TPR) repeat protein
LADALIGKQRFDEALRYLDKAREVAPEDARLPELETRLSASREAHKQQMAALAEARQQVARLLEDAESFIDQGKLVRPAGGSAFSRYQQIMALDPDNLQARTLLQRLVQLHLNGLERAYQDGDLEKARGWLDDMARIAPDNKNLALLRKELNAALVQQQARDREVASLLAEARGMTGESAAAARRSLYLEVLALDPNNREATEGLESSTAQLRLAQQRIAQERREQAEALLQRANQLLGTDNATPEDFRRAREFLLEADRASPDLDVVEQQLAALPDRYVDVIAERIEEGRYDDAAEFLHAALMLAPSNATLTRLQAELDELAEKKELPIPASF